MSSTDITSVDSFLDSESEESVEFHAPNSNSRTSGKILLYSVIAVIFFVFVCVGSFLLFNISSKVENNSRSDLTTVYQVRYHPKPYHTYQTRIIRVSVEDAEGGFSFTDSRGSGIVVPISKLDNEETLKEFRVEAKCICDPKESNEELDHQMSPSQLSSKINPNWKYSFSRTHSTLPNSIFMNSNERRAISIPVQFSVVLFLMASSFLTARKMSEQMIYDKCVHSIGHICMSSKDDNDKLLDPSNPNEIENNIKIIDQEVFESTGPGEQVNVEEEEDENLIFACKGFCSPNPKIFSKLKMPSEMVTPMGRTAVDEFCGREIVDTVFEKTQFEADTIFQRVLDLKCSAIETPVELVEMLKKANDESEVVSSFGIGDKVCVPADAECTEMSPYGPMGAM